MGTFTRSRQTVRFASFELDLQSGELHREGIKVKLQEQPFQILTLLLERPGEVVSRDELRHKLWPDDTFVDFDVGLNSAIKKLRDALGDSAEEPRFIETLPRRGYRFLMPVQADGHAAPAEAVAAPAPLPRPAWKRPDVAALTLMVLVVAVVLGVNPGALRDRLFGGSPKIESLAVLPLENLTGDPAQEYLVDGITDALITDLAQISSLRVISRTSVMTYKGKQRPLLPQIARELNVDAVVEGAVSRSGNRVRINAQLVEASTDRHLWAKEYERELTDILVLQSEVARAIAGEVRVQLTPQEQAHFAKARPVHPAAYEALLRGRYSCAKRTEAAMKKGIEFFQQAIALQPNYAQAYAELSNCYRSIQFFSSAAPEEFWPKAKAAAEKALELDDNLAEAHTSLASLLWRHDWDWAKSEAEFRRALELNPNYAEAHRAYSIYLRTVGRFEEALAESKRFRELDPLSLAVNSERASIFYFWRQYDKAVAEGQKALELEPNNLQTHFVLGRAYTQLLDFPQGVAATEKAISLSGGNPIYVADLACTYASAGEKKRARQILAELQQTAKKRYVPSYSLATVYAALGETDAAFAELEKAYAERSFLFPVLPLDPRLDPLRSDPRFDALVRGLGLPQTATAFTGGSSGQPASGRTK